jgi:translation initiation factor eIF-2B subunit delta
LTRAKTALGRDFRVAVVGGRPRVGESLKTLKALLRAGIDCAYCDFTGAAHALAPRREGGLGATKVLVGAACVTANGATVSRLGTATLAALAKERGVPVYVVAETCKFQDRIQLDAASANELGDPRDLTRVSDLSKGGLGELSEPMRGAAAGGPTGDDAGEGSGGRLAALNLEYDLSPAGFVRAIVCESGLVTPADVPSFLR